MTGFDSLPFDVIDYILNCDNLSYIDLCRLSSVSKILNCITKSNKLWKKKYAQMWPKLTKLYDTPDIDWHREFRFRINIKKLISEKLSDLSAEYYYYENISSEAFLCFKDIAGNHALGCDIVIDELESIIHHKDCHLNLTHKYYALRAVRYMRHAQLEIKWKKFLSQPSNKMSLIEGACLISEWCQPSVSKCSSEVVAELENIVKLVLERIKQLFPRHPVLKQGMLKEDRISSSLWAPNQCKNIIYCINAIMFQELKFSGNATDSCSTNGALIDEVLKKRSGMSITLGIIYSAIAAKLGVCCEPVNFPIHFLLKWLEHPGLEAEEKYTFIDAMENGALKTFNDVCDYIPRYERFSVTWAEPMAPIKVFIKWAWYLVEFGRLRDGLGEDSLALCNALELICLLNPNDMEHKLLLARLFMHLKININQAISMLQEIAAANPASPLMFGYMYQSTLQTLEAQRLSAPPITLKIQGRFASADVRFAIGMIVRHKKYNFRCVIYGWDYECSASQDWIKKMGVNKLQHKGRQPFYYVLVADGTNRYAAQENLEIDHENKPITHIKIGRYFESFHGSYYMPNEQSFNEYPDDDLARIEALRRETGREN